MSELDDLVPLPPGWFNYYRLDASAYYVRIACPGMLRVCDRGDELVWECAQVRDGNVVGIGDQGRSGRELVSSHFQYKGTALHADLANNPALAGWTFDGDRFDQMRPLTPGAWRGYLAATDDMDEHERYAFSRGWAHAAGAEA